MAVETGRTAEHQDSHPRTRDERGQAVVLAVIAMVAMIGMIGLVIDLGYAYYSQRQLQGSADAAALAGASQLPDPNAATTLAQQYGTSPGAQNAPAHVQGVSESISTKCVTTFAGCAPSNAIVVSESASVPTYFLKVFGVNSIPVHVTATACGPCGDRPADIMLVFDRTGSMCEDFNGNNDPSCSKLNNARQGMETFLGSLDPTLDRVGLVELPPAASTSAVCSTPSSSNYNSQSSAWLLVPLTSQYQSGGKIDHNSTIVHDIDCTQAGGSTAYADAIDKAQAELNKDGRANTNHYIVFFTDGAANTGPSYYPVNSPYRQTPCHQGITSANSAKGQGTTVYAIGYTLGAQGGGANRCQAQSPSGPDESPAITAYAALQQIASSGSTFYNQPSPGSLAAIFAQVASQITGPRLIPDSLP